MSTGEQMLSWHAARVLEYVHGLVAAVHDQAAADVVTAVQRLRDLPAPPGVDPVVAMATVMAAGLPADRDELRARLAWVEGLDPIPNRVITGDVSRDCDVHLLVGGHARAADMQPQIRRAAVAELTARSHTVEQIAERTGMSGRAVERYRADLTTEAC
ncbi:hypothetical protein WY02_03750 [Pseudonocardia sp. AL041005-10]|nr:hypothetical protein [Pseudonocardia sp. AL041005-10]ALE77706.1 hypothetical protein WY02_03750 [Pseudonocardia sp. AL041005-10]